MQSIKIKDNLAITYFAPTNEGKNVTKTNLINNIDKDLPDQDLLEIAILIKDLMKYNGEKVLRKCEFLLEEE